LQGVELVGFVEPLEAQRAAVAKELGVAGYASHREIMSQIDAAIIATPTKVHHSVALELLHAGKHVLVEKPITQTLAEADELILAAKQAKVALGVGHVERFNPVLRAITPELGAPKYIEASRTSGYTFRSTDVGVVLDLMIHDIDVVLSLVDSPIVDLQALGVAVLGPHEDMAQVRLTFADGCVANITASRTSFVGRRQMQVFAERGYAALDFNSREAQVVHLGDSIAQRAFDVHNIAAEVKQHIKDHLFDDAQLLAKHTVPPPEANPLFDEQQDFITAICQGCEPRVSGRAGREALFAAQQILRSISRHKWDGTHHGRIGPQALPLDTQPVRRAA
jgi:predicted dehydrogenase